MYFYKEILYWLMLWLSKLYLGYVVNCYDMVKEDCKKKLRERMRSVIEIIIIGLG